MNTDDPHLKLPSQVSNHFAHLSSSSCRCVETPLSSIVSQRKQNLRNYGVLACKTWLSFSFLRCESSVDNPSSCMCELADVVCTNLLGTMDDDGVRTTVPDPRVSGDHLFLCVPPFLKSLHRDRTSCKMSGTLLQNCQYDSRSCHQVLAVDGNIATKSWSV